MRTAGASPQSGDAARRLPFLGRTEGCRPSLSQAPPPSGPPMWPGTSSPSRRASGPRAPVPRPGKGTATLARQARTPVKVRSRSRPGKEVFRPRPSRDSRETCQRPHFASPSSLILPLRRPPWPVRAAGGPFHPAGGTRSPSASTPCGFIFLPHCHDPHPPQSTAGNRPEQRDGAPPLDLLPGCCRLADLLA